MRKVPVSVVIPAYNAAKYIENAIGSALNQTYAPLEILVVDDGSQDHTAQVIAGYAPPVRLICKENGGPASARNRAIRESCGEWIALLDADDTWMPDKLEKQITYTQMPDVGIVRCFSGQDIPDYKDIDRIDFAALWKRNMIGNSSALVRRAAYDQVGGFDEDRALIAVEDYNLWLRIAATGWAIATCSDRLWNYTPAPGNLSSQGERFALAELLNIDKILNQNLVTPQQAEQKRLAVLEQYGRELFYCRHMHSARRLFAQALKLQANPSRILWWLATFTPTSLANLQRQLRVRSPIK